MFFLTFDAKAVEQGFVVGLPRAINKSILGTDCAKETSAGEAHLYSCSNNGSTGSNQNKGAFGSVMGLTLSMYDNPPASGIIYAQQQWGKFKSNLSGEVYAQDSTTYFPGLGFNLLEAVQPFWAWARNISYGLFILVFIGIALQILFRQKIDGQNPVTLANSIPGAIVALALVSLSYVLTGLSIDLITVGTNFVKQLFVNNSFEGVTSDTVPAPDDPQTSVWFVFDSAIRQKYTGGAGQAIGGIVGGISSDNGIIQAVTNAVNSISGNDAGSALLSLIFGTSILFAALKLFFELIRRYVQIIFNVVISPFFFLLGAMPGGIEKAILPFMRGMLANSVVFIVIYALFAFMYVFMKVDSGDIGYLPPLVGIENSTTSGGIPFDSIKALLCYSLFLTTPLIPDMIQKALNAPDLTEIIQNLQTRTAQGVSTAKNLGLFVLQSAGNLFNAGVGGGGKR